MESVTISSLSPGDKFRYSKIGVEWILGSYSFARKLFATRSVNKRTTRYVEGDAFVYKIEDSSLIK